MRVIGLCGGSGSGKGTVAKLLFAHGFMHIDTDEIYHSITSYMSPCLLELKEHFGEDIVKGGALDRDVLWRRVFCSSDSEGARVLLNQITHKHILDETLKLICEYRDKGKEYVLVDAPLLFESGFDKLCSLLICVVADVNIRAKRIVLRDGIDEERAMRRIASQIGDDDLRSRCDFCIENSGNLDELRYAVDEVAQKIKLLK